MHRHVFAALAAVVAAAALGCAPGRGSERASLERPPAPLDSLPLASDVRLDSAGYLAGSFVGEGTSRQVHLLSSDTVLIETLARRFRPDLVQDEPDLWGSLRRARVVSLTPRGQRRPVAGDGPRAVLAMVGSPLGHTEVTVSEVLLRGS